MSREVSYEPVRDPQDLAKEWVAREAAGDAAGMAELYEPNAILACGDGRFATGRKAIQDFYAGFIVEARKAGTKFDLSGQRAAMVTGNLALTSARIEGGTVTAEVARRQADGSWLWAIDNPAFSRLP